MGIVALRGASSVEPHMFGVNPVVQSLIKYWTRIPSSIFQEYQVPEVLPMKNRVMAKRKGLKGDAFQKIVLIKVLIESI